MKQVLQIGNCRITGSEIFPLLASYQMLPELRRYFITDSVIKAIELTVEEANNALKQFVENNQITTHEQHAAFLQQEGMTQGQLEALATRELRIEKFKIATWGNRIESHFLANKSQFDKVVYSLLRTDSMEVAQELFFRIQDGEQSFAECARLYSIGQEAQTGGLIGPVELSAPHPALARMLATLQPGELLPPTPIIEWVVILRLEKLIPAQLDDAMRSFLLNQMFEAWLTEEISKTQLSIITDTPEVTFTTPALLLR